MGQFSVVTGTDIPSKRIYDIIISEIGKNFPIVLSEKEIYLTTNDEKETIKLADILSRVIMDEYEDKILLKLIDQNYYYFTKKEKRRIYKIALEYLISDNNLLMSYMQRKRNFLIKNKLTEYMNDSDNIIIDGFVNFRLKEYEIELEEILSRAVEDFMLEREYDEFIKLLKYFVELQEPKLKTIHIILTNDEYKILNENKIDITQKCKDEFSIEEGITTMLRSGDLLLSILISNSPKKIIMHQTENLKNQEIMKTISAVFEKRIINCAGCEFCNK